MSSIRQGYEQNRVEKRAPPSVVAHAGLRTAETMDMLDDPEELREIATEVLEGLMAEDPKEHEGKRTRVKVWHSARGLVLGHVDAAIWKNMVRSMAVDAVAWAGSSQSNGRWELGSFELWTDKAPEDRYRDIGGPDQEDPSTLKHGAKHVNRRDVVYKPHFFVGMSIVDTKDRPPIVYEQGVPLKSGGGIDIKALTDTLLTVLGKDKVAELEGARDDEMERIKSENATLAKRLAAIEARFSAPEEPVEAVEAAVESPDIESPDAEEVDEPGAVDDDVQARLDDVMNQPEVDDDEGLDDPQEIAKPAPAPAKKTTRRKRGAVRKT